MKRVQKSAVPNTRCDCTLMTPGGTEKGCVYRDGNGTCDTPRTNKGNSDAACYRMGNAELLKHLEPWPVGEAES